MKYDFLGVVVFGLVLLVGFAMIISMIALIAFLIKALIRYSQSGGARNNARKENSDIEKSQKSLGEILKQHREACKMTQEFVAEAVGVSRQAVSKWENGTSDPSTSNLIALAKLFKISAEDLLREVQ